MVPGHHRHSRPSDSPARRAETGRSSALSASSRLAATPVRAAHVPGSPPRPWIPLPFRSRCRRSHLQAPRRLRSPWPGRAGCSGRCSGAAAATAATAGARALPVCLSTRLPAPSLQASRAVAGYCCCSGPPRPPPLRRGAFRSGLGLHPPGGWRGRPLRLPLPPPRLPPLTRPFEPLCCRSRWRRPRAQRGATARYVVPGGAARGTLPRTRARVCAPPRASRVRARGTAAHAAHPPPPPPAQSSYWALEQGTLSLASGFLLVLFSGVWSVGQC